MDRKTTKEKEKSKDSNTLSIFYIFKFINGTSRHFDIKLDETTMNCIPPVGPYPEWTSMDFHKCTVCSYKAEHCPVAVNISGIVDAFIDISPDDSTHVLIMAKDRDYSKSTTLQEGLTALLGLCMAASPCPVMGKLKPLARYHLPFATLNESVFRVASMYLLVQYFLAGQGITPDWKLKGLNKIYEDIHEVNVGISKRIKKAANRDASLKALAKLDYTASLVPHVVNETLDEIEASLSSYMEDQ